MLNIPPVLFVARVFRSKTVSLKYSTSEVNFAKELHLQQLILSSTGVLDQNHQILSYANHPYTFKYPWVGYQLNGFFYDQVIQAVPSPVFLILQLLLLVIVDITAALALYIVGQYRGEVWRHVTMVAKCLDHNKRKLRQQRQRRQREGQKSNKFILVKQQVCRCIKLFCTFFSNRCTIATWNFLISLARFTK